MEELAESPLLYVGMVQAAGAKYIDPSGLSAQEKEDARLQFERFARGMYEGKLSQADFDEVTAPISVTGPDGRQEIKPQLTDEEVRALVARIKTKADEAQVPNERFQINVPEEFGKAIERAEGSRPPQPAGS